MSQTRFHCPNVNKLHQQRQEYELHQVCLCSILLCPKFTNDKRLQHRTQYKLSSNKMRIMMVGRIIIYANVHTHTLRHTLLFAVRLRNELSLRPTLISPGSYASCRSKCLLLTFLVEFLFLFRKFVYEPPLMFVLGNS